MDNTSYTVFLALDNPGSDFIDIWSEGSTLTALCECSGQPVPTVGLGGWRCILCKRLFKPKSIFLKPTFLLFPWTETYAVEDWVARWSGLPVEVINVGIEWGLE